MTNRKSEARGDYVIGYGRPPKGTQFKPGQSGNQKGRPRGSKNLITLLHEELERTVTIIEQGKHKKITKRRALAIQTVSRALNNDAKAVTLVFANDQAREAASTHDGRGEKMSPEVLEACARILLEKI